ncbi:MAG: isochorismatase family protein [Bacteroidota bacterium]
MRIFKENCIAVMVDVQEKLLPHMHNHEALLGKMVKLAKGLKMIEVPLLVTQQYTKGLGKTVDAFTDVLGDFNYTEKLTFSCYGEPSFLQTVKSHSREYIIIFGIESHVCVLQTALDLIEHGYIPVVVEDCVSSRNPKDIEIAMNRIRQEGGIVSGFESILFELIQTAEYEHFKTISKIVK